MRTTLAFMSDFLLFDNRIYIVITFLAGVNVPILLLHTRVWPHNDRRLRQKTLLLGYHRQVDGESNPYNCEAYCAAPMMGARGFRATRTGMRAINPA